MVAGMESQSAVINRDTQENALNRAPESRPDFNLYTYQQDAMPILLGWGIGSTLAGLVWRRSASSWLRGLGIQFIGWGIVDALIASFAIANAANKSAQVDSGEITKVEHRRQSEQFERIVWLNALLDIGYILGGSRMVKRSQQNRQRRGMGWGIIIQGLFLFIWDVLLASTARRKRRDT